MAVNGSLCSVQDGEGSEDGFDDDDSLSDWNLSKYSLCSTLWLKTCTEHKPGNR